MAGGNGVGEFPETVERRESEGDGIAETEIVQEATGEVHPLAFVVWSHNLKKGDKIAIHVNLPPPGE